MPAAPLHLVKIESLDDPRVADYRNLQDAQLRHLADPEAPGLFMAEGELVVRQLVRSRLRTRSVFITQPRLDSLWPDLQALPAGTPIFTADQDLMNGIVGFNIHRGVLAAGERPADPDLNQVLSSSATLLVLEDLANHDNVGGIFRATAALAGIAVLGSPTPAGASILLSPRCCDPLYRKAIRVSMGAALQVPFSRLTPWTAALANLRSRGWTLVALTPDPAAIAIDHLPPISRPALMLGAEGPGLTESALASAEIRVRIPISPAVDSLNVVTAAAIALHRLARP